MSEPLDGQTDYQVSCTSEQFVHMSARAALPLVNADGTPFHFHMLSGSSNPARSQPQLAQAQAATSVTAMRVSSARSGNPEQVEILVSF